jgi:uncharacterized protein
MENQELQELVWQKKFTEIEAVLTNNPAAFERINTHNRNQFFETLLKNNAFSIVHLLVKQGAIETDLYEYESWKNSIFLNIVKDLPTDEASLGFLKDFLSKLDSLNDAIDGMTLITLAINEKAKPEIVKALIEGGCNATYKNNAESTYLHQALNQYGILPDDLKVYTSLFLNEGVDINAEDIVKKTPLHIALERNNVDILPLLLENGADANHQNKEGKSAFYKAIVDTRSLKAYKILAEHAQIDFDQTTRDGETLFYKFISMTGSNPSVDELQMFASLMESGSDFNQTSLHYGKPKSSIDLLAEKSFALFEKAIASGKIDIHEPDNEGNTLLHKICAYDLNHDQNKAKESYKKVKLLISEGADVALTNNQDQTALNLASTDNLKEKIVEILLRK